MSVFRRGVRIAHGAHVDELPSDDSDSDTEDELEMHAREEKAEVSDVGEEEDDSGPVNLNWKYEPDPNAVESEEEEEERPEGAEPQFPITCALCSGKTLFSMKEVTDHMASARHQKKEKESEQALKKAKRTPDQEVGVSGAPDAKAARRENREAMTVPLKASKRADGRAKMRGEGNQHQRRFGKKTAPAGGE
ncbi:hypothetical protein T484DRAFT_1973186 [Baffinella frigidus]|nr:hypothetical protein T484DRAFT_1973186 [Cryptophyta sp. CCMP2293]